MTPINMAPATTTARGTAENVLVTLSVKYHGDDFPYPERRIHLDRSSGSVKIGRTSKRVEELAAALNNCWFDSPVMSRNHAEIFVDWFYSKVYIKDIGSLHGTYRNQDKVHPGVPQALAPGDTLRFGIDIQRSSDLYPPCTAEVAIEFGADQATTAENAQPTVFQVPDGSDSDIDSSSDEEDDDVRVSLEILRRTGIRRAPRIAGGANEDLIDLTQDSTSQIVNDAQVIPAPNRVPVPIDLDQVVPGLTSNVFIDLTGEFIPERFPSIESDAPHEAEEEEKESDPESTEMEGIVAYEDTGESDAESMFEERETSVDYPEEQASQASREPSHAFGASDAEDGIRLSDSASSENDGEGETDADDSSERYSDDSSLEDVMSADETADDYNNVLWADDEGVNEVDQPAPIPDIANLPALQQLPSIPDHPALAFQPMAPLYNPQSPIMARDNVCRLPSILNPSGMQQHYASPSINPPYLSLPPWQQRPLPVDVTINQSPVEKLGYKTGKFEFFAARESNKEVVARQQQQSGPLPPITQISQPLLASPTIIDTATTAENTSQMQTGKDTSEPKTVMKQAAVGSAWSASGERFLNSPPQDFPSLDERDGSPEFDMTSAFQFQQSKLAAESRDPNASITNALHIDEMTDDSADEPEQVLTPKSLKRKADDISTLSLEEQTDEAYKIATPVGAGAVEDEELENVAELDNTIVAQPSVAPDSASALTSPRSGKPDEETRAPKRMRRVAEAVGYVALGGAAAGVAFLSTLIATAPSFS